MVDDPRAPRHWTPGALYVAEQQPGGAIVLRRELLTAGGGGVTLTVHERTCSGPAEAEWYQAWYGHPGACPAPWGCAPDPGAYPGGAVEVRTDAQDL